MCLLLLLLLLWLSLLLSLLVVVAAVVIVAAVVVVVVVVVVLLVWSLRGPGRRPSASRAAAPRVPGDATNTFHSSRLGRGGNGSRLFSEGVLRSWSRLVIIIFIVIDDMVNTYIYIYTCNMNLHMYICRQTYGHAYVYVYEYHTCTSCVFVSAWCPN